MKTKWYSRLSPVPSERNRESIYLAVLFCFCFLLHNNGRIFAQGSCPVNIGFEKGDFTGWVCYDGKIDTRGVISTVPTAPIKGKHTLYKNVAPQERDTFGGFPVNCPNGSGYSVKLGNHGAGSEAQALTYTFTIPAGQNDYSIIYNYAVVLQNPPGHAPYEQPQFMSRVFDVTANKYLDCGAFQFIAAPNLPGFRESAVEPNIYYKDWAPVTIKLSGYAGKTIRLEFTVNDCSKAVHFGYAYLDVDENCTTPITGNTYCKGTGAVILKAPYGFKEYYWFDENGNAVGTGNTLSLNPPPPGNTQYTLQIVPFPGQGCQDTLHTTIIASSDFMKLQTVDSVRACPNPGADLTHPSITAGSTAGLKLEYFTNIQETEFIDNAAAVSASGLYYIKATSSSGCTETRPVMVRIDPPPLVSITQPAPICTPGTVDLTQASLVSGSDANLQYSYWQDTLASVVLQNPSSVSIAGNYFIKGTNTTGCSTIKKIVADISNPPQLTTHNISGCGSLAFNAATVAASTDPTVAISYWQDITATLPASLQQVFTSNSVVYIKAKAAGGCSIIKPVNITINPNPSFTVANPPVTTRPASVDLSTTASANNGLLYSYWQDEAATKPLSNPASIIQSGTYYIKGTDAKGCSAVNPVTVTITDPPVTPPNAFSPNSDGINDTWLIPLLSYYPDCIVEIFTRHGVSVFKSAGYTKPWDGKLKDTDLPVGTYYYMIRLAPGKAPVSGSVTLIR